MPKKFQEYDITKEQDEIPGSKWND